MRLTPDEIKELKNQGYTEQEIRLALMDLEREELSNSYQNVQQQRTGDPRRNSMVSSFATRENEDLIRWQLELNDILERIEHILRGDVPSFEQGNIIWKECPDPKANTLNETGVNEIMKILALYVNRNKILADYTNDEIMLKVFDFSRALNNLIFMRDFEFGMDTEEKRKNYEMLVSEMRDTVHDSYKRALNGAEKRSLREMITVSQSSSTSSQLGGGVTINNQGQPQKERSWLNPMRFVKGKYA